jgi:ABC-type transport system substrate-binding protein
MTYSTNRRQFLLAASSITALAGLSACGFTGSGQTQAGASGGESGTSAAAASKKDAVYAQSVQVTSLEPSGKQPQGYPAGYEAAFAIFSGLVRFTKDLTFEPELATEWTTSSDGLTWRFKLRSGVKFHDGTPFDAKAVVPYFTSMTDKTVNLSALSLWSPIASVKEVDSMTVEIVTKKPYGAMLNTLAHGSALIPSPASVLNKADFALKPVGCGPYKLDTFAPGQQLVVKANLDYWRGKPTYDSITYKYVGDATGRVAALQSGQADIIDAVPVEQAEQLKAAADVKVMEIPGLQVFGVGLRVTASPLQDKAVRQALNYAVDKKSLVNAVFRGHATVMDSPLAPNTTGHVTCGSYDFSVEKANSMLDQAGWGKGGDGVRAKGGTRLSLKLRTPDGMYPNDVRVAQVVQDQLKAVGVEVTIDKIDKARFWDSIKVPANKVDFDMVLFGYNPSHGNGAIHMDAMFRTNPSQDSVIPQWNFNWYSSKVVDDSITKGQETVDPAKLGDSLSAAQKTVWEDSPYIWLYVKNNIVAYSTKVAPPTVLPVVFTLPSR